MSSCFIVSCFMPSCIASSFFIESLCMLSCASVTEGIAPRTANPATAKTAFHPRTMNRFLLQIVAVPQGTFAPHVGVRFIKKETRIFLDCWGSSNSDKRSALLRTAKNGQFQWFANGVGLLFGLLFCRLKSLAFATGKVAVLRKFRILVHGTVHSYVNTLRMTAGTALDSCVVHRWFASPAPGIATPSESVYIPSNSLTACIRIIRSLQTVSPRVAASAPHVLAD